MRQEIFVNLPMRRLTKKGRDPVSLPFLVITSYPVADSWRCRVNLIFLAARAGFHATALFQKKQQTFEAQPSLILVQVY